MIKKCKYCDKEFKVRHSNNIGKYCSKPCADKARIGVYVGSKSPTWKGGKRPISCKLCGKVFHLHPSKIEEGRKFCSQSCGAINSLLNAKKENTKIEIKMRDALSKRGIDFEMQHPISAACTVPDLFIHPNICIYCDGDYWHNIPNTRDKDIRQTKELNRLGYKVYRFWEHDIINDVGRCVEIMAEEQQWI